MEGHAGGAPGYSCHMYVLNCKENEEAGLILLSNGPFLVPAALFGRVTMNSYKNILEVISEKIDTL